MKKTYQPKASEVTRAWHLYDAKDQVLGRLASEIAMKLMGKHKPTYSAHMDSGDFVVVVNSELIAVTGRKELLKVYYGHSGYPGGFKEVAYSQVKRENPSRILELAVRRMLPVNRLRDERMARLRLVVGTENPYHGQTTQK
ncbi:50S ribosomal protein L13 [Candidatus Woesebacteria bacterium]|jgi:large subunit ribosomal protein L13|nr:50S ribosomal protein L13 [Candidatus Woesebacteria bacterium]MBP9687048.1 50S ribosomal protein L13 [Candidatus Woesebacteria bacterium]